MSSELKVYTYSELQQFTDCEREYGYRYEELLEPVFDGVARPIGTAVHVGLEQIYNGLDLGVALADAHERYFADLSEYIELQGKPAPTDESPEADAVRKVMGGWKIVERLLKNYPWLDVPEVLHTEAEIVVPMGLGRAYKGRIDRITMVNGGLWNHDTKTSGMQPRPVIQTMRLRHQFAGYKHLVDKWLSGEAIEAPPIPDGLKGNSIDGTVLDLLFKPRVTFHRKAKQYTGEVSCKGESYHREPLHISDSKCAEFEQWFHVTAERIEYHQQEAPAYTRPMNTGKCFQYNSVCPFFERCRFDGDRHEMGRDDYVMGQNFKRRAHKHDY